ncbi:MULTISPECIES: TraU family protein [Halomonas]|uniref:TraU family protein n=1 Tax=Halomonas TaxID=2745 RepID=UPI003CED919F
MPTLLNRYATLWPFSVMRTLMLLAATLTMMAGLPAPAYAQDVPGGGKACHNAQVLGPKLITNVCWSCFFPIRVAGIPLNGSNSGHPSGAASSPMCLCPGAMGIPTPGIVMSMWEPARMVEFQRQSGCSSVLNGTRLPLDRLNQGSHGTSESLSNDDQKFTHYHYYAFPLMSMLDLFSLGGCTDGYLDMDLMYLSELDPTWNNSELAFFTNPEAAAVASATAQASCGADAVASTAGSPIDSMFWCAGAWGSMYPFSGHTAGKTLMQATSLYKARVLAALHRRGLARQTMGSSAVCGAHTAPMIPKSQYKFTTFHLRPETSRAHAFGESSMFWGSARMLPGVSDPIYLIWRWKDCCANL